MKIQTKISALFLGTTTLSLLFFGYVIFFNFKTVQQDDILDRLDETAQFIRTQSESYLTSLKGRMVDFSSDGKIKDCLSDLDHLTQRGCTVEELSNHLRINKLPAVQELTRVIVLDQHGNVVASSDPSDMRVPSVCAKCFSIEKHYPFVHLDTDDPKHITIHVSAPVQTVTGNGIFLGVVVGEMNLSHFTNLLDEGTKLGPSEERLLIAKNADGNAVFITPRKYDGNVGDIIPKDQTNLPAMKAIQKHEGVIVESMDYRGVPVVAATRYIEALDAGLVVKVDKHDAYIPVQLTEFSGLIIGLIAFILTTLVMFGLSKSISDPIKDLTRAAKSIQNGNLNAHINRKLYESKKRDRRSGEYAYKNHGQFARTLQRSGTKSEGTNGTTRRRPDEHGSHFGKHRGRIDHRRPTWGDHNNQS